MSTPITVAEAADIIGCGHESIHALCRAGSLKARKVGLRWEIDRASAEAYRIRPKRQGKSRQFDPRVRRGK